MGGRLVWSGDGGWLVAWEWWPRVQRSRYSVTVIVLLDEQPAAFF